MLQLPVEIPGDDVGENRGGRRSLREHIPFLRFRSFREINGCQDRLVIIEVDLSAAETGDSTCHVLIEADRFRLQGAPYACLGNTGKEILQVQVQDIVHPDMLLRIIHDTSAGDKAHCGTRRLIECLKKLVGVCLERLEHLHRS